MNVVEFKKLTRALHHRPKEEANIGMKVMSRSHEGHRRCHCFCKLRPLTHSPAGKQFVSSHLHPPPHVAQSTQSSPPLIPALLLLLLLLPVGGGGASVGVVHDGLHVVPREEAGGSAHHTLEPAVVIFLDDIDDGAFLERQLVLLVPHVVIDGHH